jgi:hypothetical protein
LDADDWYDDDCVDWEPPTEYMFEDGSPAPNPEEVSGYEIVAEREEADSWDDEGAVDGIVRFVTVRKLPRPVAGVVPGRAMIHRRALGRSRPRARRSPSASRSNARGSPARPRPTSDEDDDPADLTTAARGGVRLLPPVETTPLQDALLAEYEFVEAVNARPSPREREAFRSITRKPVDREDRLDCRGEAS